MTNQNTESETKSNQSAYAIEEIVNGCLTNVSAFILVFMNKYGVKSSARKKKTWQCIDLKIKLVKWWSSILNFQYCWLKSYLLCLKVCFDNIIPSGKQYKREENEQS